MRDYEQWHDDYDDPASDLSWRLGVVQGYLADALDEKPGPVTVLSLCAGEGRDVIEVLRGRDDAGRVRAVLVELHPAIAERARAAVGDLDVDVRTADAADPAQWADAAPADVVLLVGIFGNIPADDLRRTVSASPSMCRGGSILLWSRGVRAGQEPPNDAVRQWVRAAGFTELDYRELGRDDRPALGLMRYDGPPVPLDRATRLFTFVR